MSLQFVSTIIILATKPFSLFKQFCIFSVRSIWIVVQTWIELLSAAIWLHVHIFWSILVWTVTFVSLPARILNALQRERLLEMYLREMQVELENLVWDKKELEEQLNMAIKERKVMEVMLAELEEEHDQAIIKIELLEGELQDLNDRNHRLEEVQHKAFRSSTQQLDMDKKPSNTNISTTLRRTASPKSINRESYVTLDEHPIHKGTYEADTKFKTQNPIRTGSLPDEPADPFSPDPAQLLYERREVALLQSLFSAILSLVVGIVVLEAKDPCIPLVIALFSVVGMSLKSVVQFFFTIKNKPASDAVALLSFNWFILGTLSYPTLPRIARVLMPYWLNFSMWTLSWLGLYT